MLTREAVEFDIYTVTFIPHPSPRNRSSTVSASRAGRFMKDIAIAQRGSDVGGDCVRSRRGVCFERDAWSLGT